MKQIPVSKLSASLSGYNISTTVEVYMNNGKVMCQVLVCTDSDGDPERAVSMQSLQFDKESGIATSSYSLLNNAQCVSLASFLDASEIEAMICKSIGDIEHQSKALELSQRISKGLLHNLKNVSSHVFTKPFPSDNDFNSDEYTQLSAYLSQQVRNCTLLVR